jgi:luciferase family oxidoreductase group 1
MTAGPFGVRLDVKKIPLSVLELAPVTAGADTAQALQYTTELARRVEELGYRRIWVAEHHNIPAIASSSPAVLIAHLAAVTSTIRVGSGGVMLPNHAPLVVAEQFGTLASLHPGRIDLGVGRAPGTDQRTALALRRTPDGLSAENFPSEFADVVRMLAGDPSRLKAVPAPAELPEIWLLGSSGFSAQLAGELGLPFSFAHHFSAANTEPALELYRRSFRPSQWLDEPHTMVAVNAVCADTDEHAELLARPGWLAFLRLRMGRPIALPTIEDAAAYEFTEPELEFVAQRRVGQALGSPQTVQAQLAALIERTGADELMLTNQVYGIKDRMRSYELIAELAVG